MASTDPTKKKPGDPPLAAAAEPFAFNEEGGEAFVDFGDVAPIHEGASGVIPLDELPDPPSGQSLTSWTAVIRRQREAAEAAGADDAPDILPALPVTVDAPSDQDLLSHLMTADAHRRPTGNSSSVPLGGAFPSPSDTMEIPAADLPIHAEAAEAVDDEAGDDDLRMLMAGRGPASASPSGGSEIHFGLPAAPDDAGGIHPAPGMSAKAKADDSDAIPIEAGLGTGGSSAMLGDLPAGAPEGARSSILDVLLSESNLDIPTLTDDRSGDRRAPEEDSGLTPFRSTRPTVPAAGGYGRPSQPTQPSIDIGDDADMGTLSHADEGSESKYGSEILAPTQFDMGDDAVDLYSDEAPPPSISDSGSFEISAAAMDEAVRKQKAAESSSVDMSSRPSLHGSHFEMGPEDEEEAAIDLGLPPAPTAGDSSMIRARDMEEDSAVLREQLEANRRERKAAKRREDEDSGAVVVAPAREKSGIAGALIGTAAGLLVGAGSVFGMWAGGLLPGQEQPKTVATTPATGGADPKELAAAKEDADTAKKGLSDYQAAVAKAFAAAKIENPEQGLAALPTLVGDRDAAVAKAAALQTDVKTQQDKAADAAKAEMTAKADLKTAQDALTASETKATDAVKAAETATAGLASLNKSLKDAGIDPAKPADAVKDLMAKRADAEKAVAMAKDEATRLTKVFEDKMGEARKATDDAKKTADVAKKAALDAQRELADLGDAKAAADKTMKALGEKLAKAKFVPANADPAALLKGVDDALKAGTTDATAALRDELVKSRDAMTKAKADVETLTAKQQAAEKAAAAADEQAKKATADLKAAMTKAETELTAAKAAGDKAMKDAADLTAKATAATAKADQAATQRDKAAADLAATKTDLGGQVAKLKTENESLARDLAAVKELSLAIKSQANTGSPAAKPDPAALADRFFSDGVRQYYAGRYGDAEASLVKTIALFSDDARYHYMLGLSQFALGKQKEAETAFSKGSELESQGRPAGRRVDAILERIQGRARQVVNSYRP